MQKAAKERLAHSKCRPSIQDPLGSVSGLILNHSCDLQEGLFWLGHSGRYCRCLHPCGLFETGEFRVLCVL